ncbi:MAG: putative sulfate exporter family transporter [Bdellovibrionales bacterium]|nr:putative sulfate exporter family transporter [Bdellovibrionales bacterium]
MKREFLPGWLLMLALSVAAIYGSKIVEVGGKHPLEAPVLAIVFGMLVRNLGFAPEICRPGIKAFEKILIAGIVLVGASLDFNLFMAQGVEILSIITVTMLVGLISIVVLARLFALPKALGVLLAVGTTICGGTAIAVTAPMIKAKEEETSYAIGTIALWGLVAIIAYPMIARALGVSDATFGLFAGTSIHSTPQVVGAGFIFSDEAGKMATAVKLVRNCFLAPMAFLVAIWYAGSNLTEAETPDAASRWNSVAKGFPWFLFGYFIMAGLNTAGYFTAEGISGFSDAGKFLILLGMAGIGLNTVFATFKGIGLRPFIVGLIGSIIVAAASAGLISAFGSTS